MIKKPKRPKKWKPKIISKNPCEYYIQEIERLRKAIKTHRNNVWGRYEVEHHEDVVLYKALEE